MNRDGKEVLQDFRAFWQMPIIAFSARARETENVFADQLRAKIEPDPANPVIIRTEPGVGYWLVEC